MSYQIKRDYIPHGKSRSGKKISGYRFGVAHDTGNSGSSAAGNVNWFSGNPISASAHTFIDDKEIIEMVPLNEKAWHVRYNVGADNRIFGDDANDVAIGVELCYGGNIDFDEAYKRYVWYFAYLCEKFGWNPRTDIVGHSRLDPGRKTDPENALHRHGISFEQFIEDVTDTMNNGDVTVNTTESVKSYLSKGDSGKRVTVAQKGLLQLGYDLGGYGADGQYGPATIKAVEQFQKDNDLVVDGYYGSNTRTALEAKIEETHQPPEPDSDKLYRLMTGPFPDAESLANGKERLQDAYPWLIYERASDTDFDPEYRLWTGTFEGKNVAEHQADALSEEFGWTVYVKEA